MGIPLSWLQLTSERKRFAVAIAGITFAVTMMLFQIGLHGALYRQVVGPLQLLDCDIVLVGANYEYFGVGRGFPIVRLYQSRALAEVADANFLKLGCASFKNVDNGKERDIFIIAFDPSKNVFTAQDIKRNSESLKRDGAILYDAASRGQYGDVVQKYKTQPDGKLRTEIAGKKTTITGLIKIGPTFAADGNILTSLKTFSKIWQGSPDGVVDVGTIKLKPGSDAKVAVEKLKKILPEDVVVMTKGDFIKAEKEYWSVRTPIGFVIGASMAVALFVGAVIVYQILYTDVSDHIPEYATLKAIGFSDSFFVWIIIQESLILSVLGFIPGAIFSEALYILTRNVANMPTYMSLTNLLIVFAFSLSMCVIAGLLATKKLRRANPADIF